MTDDIEYQDLMWVDRTRLALQRSYKILRKEALSAINGHRAAKMDAPTVAYLTSLLVEANPLDDPPAFDPSVYDVIRSSISTINRKFEESLSSVWTSSILLSAAAILIDLPKQTDDLQEFESLCTRLHHTLEAVVASWNINHRNTLNRT